MSVSHETYMEMFHALIHGVVEGVLRLDQVARLLWATAQPVATENLEDITVEVRAALTDWPHESRGMLIAVENVQITIPCPQIHDQSRECDKEHHMLQLTRVIGTLGWEPNHVPSSIDFDEVIYEIATAHHPDKEDVRKVRLRSKGSIGGLEEVFEKMFDAAPIEREINDFRDELDKLFPSIPTQGKENPNDDSTATG